MEPQRITREFADRFAEEWIAAWNARDLPRVLGDPQPIEASERTLLSGEIFEDSGSGVRHLLLRRPGRA